MQDDEYIFLPLTILGIPCRYNALLSGHIQLGEYSVAVREQASRAGFSTKHVVIDSREPDMWRALRKRLVDWGMNVHQRALYTKKATQMRSL
ncbi:hypothetical protein ACEXEL_001852 [Citrobacter koseri]